ncbi:hypothetical protein P3T29_000104 [Kitasatospora sp. MAP5-34]|nr:hypothetical protein [Kitasatospora sp. MAP5-34]
MDPTSVDLDKPLRVHPLTYLEEGDEVTVGRADINSYGLFPTDGAALLRHLEEGHSPNESARWYAEQFGDQVDILEFLEVLTEFELLVQDGEEAAEAAPVRWQRLGRALFSPVAWAAYALLTGAGVVAMVRDHSLVPSYQHLFFTRSSLVLLMLGIVLGQVPWILLHEAFHALAGRRLGLNSTLRISRRFYYVVFVTSLDGLVAVPRRKRYLPMLAGMLLDVLAIAALTLGAAALHSAGGFGGLVGKLFLSMAFGVVLRLAWQFYFFLRTDLYYLATTVLGCNDLHTAARQLIANRVNRLLGRRDKLVDEADWHPRDAAVARWYSWLMVAGYAVLTVLLVTAVVPAAISITRLALHKLGADLSPLNIFDVCLFLVLNFGELVLAGVLALRQYRRRARPTVA